MQDVIGEDYDQPTYVYLSARLFLAAGAWKVTGRRAPPGPHVEIMPPQMEPHDAVMEMFDFAIQIAAKVGTMGENLFDDPTRTIHDLTGMFTWDGKTARRFADRRSQA